MTPSIIHPPSPVELAKGEKFQTRAERDLQARMKALRPYVAALPPEGSTALVVAAALWSRTDVVSCVQAGACLTVARRHGLVERLYTRGGTAVYRRTAAGDAMLIDRTAQLHGKGPRASDSDRVPTLGKRERVEAESRQEAGGPAQQLRNRPPNP